MRLNRLAALALAALSLMFGAPPAFALQQVSLFDRTGVVNIGTQQDPLWVKMSDLSVSANFSPYTPVMGYPLVTATTTSQRIALHTGDTAIDITNGGSSDLMYAFGDATVDASASNFRILAGREKGLTIPAGATYVAFATASGTTTVDYTTGTGMPAMAGGGGGGSGGAVTAASGAFLDGWDVTGGAKADPPWDGVSAATRIAVAKLSALQAKAAATALGLSTDSCPNAASACSIDGRLARLEQIAEDPTISAPVTLLDSRPSSGTISAADSTTTSVTGMANVPQVTGNPTTNSSLDFAINTTAAQAIALVTVTGTFNGTIQMEGSGDLGGTGGHYVPLSGQIRGANQFTSAITGPTVISLPISGVTNLRFRASSWTSGSATVKVTLSPAPGDVKLASPAILAAMTSSGAAAQVPMSDTPANFSANGATVKVISGAAGKNIYVGSIRFGFSVAGTIQWEAGTQTTTPCDTGAVALGQPLPFAQNGGIAQGIGLGNLIPGIPTGKDLCAVVTGTASGTLAYAQY